MTANRDDAEFRPLTRRHVLVAGAVSVAGIALAACSSSGSGQATSTSSATTTDFSQRFARFTADTEPNGDLAKVVWPDFVTSAGPEVKGLYQFQITHGELMRYMPCFCGCGQDAGHRSNRDCYVKAVNADGSVELESMAPT